MAIMGVALLAACTLAGLVIGEALGRLFGLNVNVGGVGIAMLLLILVADWLDRRELLSLPSRQGVEFWGAIYVPIVVAMAAQQDVAGAIAGGPAAVLAGAVAVGLGFALVPVIAGRSTEAGEVAPPVEEPPVLTPTASVPDESEVRQPS